MFRGLLDSRYHYKCSLCEGLKKGSVSGSLTCITHRMSSRLLPILLDQERTVTTALPIITMMMHACVCAFATPWTITAHQVPLSMEFSRQECWSGLPFPIPNHDDSQHLWHASYMLEITLSNFLIYVNPTFQKL